MKFNQTLGIRNSQPLGSVFTMFELLVIIAILPSMLLVAPKLVHAETQPQRSPNGFHVGNELLVKWQDGNDSYAASVGNSRFGAKVDRNFNEIGWQLVRLPKGLPLSEAIANYMTLGTVLAAEPNVVAVIDPPPVPSVAATPASASDFPAGDPNQSRGVGLQSASGQASGVVPNDPKFNSQWNLKKIGMPNAWAVTTGSTSVVVAVIDTGVDYKHPDLAPNMWHNPGETGLDANGNANQPTESMTMATVTWMTCMELMPLITTVTRTTPVPSAEQEPRRASTALRAQR